MSGELQRSAFLRWRVLIVLGGVLVSAALLTSVCCRIINEVIPRRVVVTPVLDMNVDLGSMEPQSRLFSFKYPGRHSVNVDLELRHGPQGSCTKNKKFVLAGTVEIVDYDRDLSLRRNFNRALLDCEVGVRRLIEFNTDEVGLKGEKLFRITLAIAPEFREHYSEMSVFIRKELKYPILD